MHKLLVSSLLGLLVAPLTAQCFDPNFGTPLGTGPDTVFPIQPIGFAFPLAGANYSDIHVSDKGYAFFSNAGVPAPGTFGDFTATSAELALESPRVCALWADIQSLASNNSLVYINSTATKCTVTWENLQCYAQTCGLFTIQMQLLPTGEVFFFYGTGTTNNSTQPTWQVGIVGISPGLGSVLPAASDLSATGVTTDNTLFEEFLAPNTFDMAGSGLHLVPTNPGWVFTGPNPQCASTTNNGIGCYNQPESFYETYDPFTFDMSNTTITMIRSGTGYLALGSVPGTFVPPGGGAVQVAIGDDVEQTVALSAAMPCAGGSTTQLTVCSNGQVAFGATGNGVGWTPDVPTFLGWTTGAVACWHDYNQTLPGSGQILFEEVAGVAYVTWNGVYSYGTTSPATFQFQFDIASGNVTMVFQTMTPDGNNYLIGYTAPGVSSDPGALDLSVALASTVSVSDTELLPLSLTANGLPSLGNASFSLDTSNVPNLVPIAFLFFGDTPLPGIDLGFIGAPDCRAYTNANLTSVTFPVSLPAGTGSVPLGIPANPGLIGASLTAQSVAFTLLNALGLATSNGTTFTVGL